MYPNSPQEGKNFGYVLSGSKSIVVGNKKNKAKKGEAFYFEPKFKHYIESKGGAVIIWVSSPPSF